MSSIGVALVFKRRLVHGVALVIIAQNNFVPVLKSLIANVLKYKTSLKTKFTCICVTAVNGESFTGLNLCGFHAFWRSAKVFPMHLLLLV